jgi:hypothetical protein
LITSGKLNILKPAQANDPNAYATNLLQTSATENKLKRQTIGTGARISVPSTAGTKIAQRKRTSRPEEERNNPQRTRERNCGRGGETPKPESLILVQREQNWEEEEHFLNSPIKLQTPAQKYGLKGL